MNREKPKFEMAFNHDGFGILTDLADTEMTEADAAKVLVEPLVMAGISLIDWCILTTGQHNCRTRHKRGFKGDGQGRAIDHTIGKVVSHYNALPNDLLDIVVKEGHKAGLRVFGNIRLNHGALNTERLLSCPGRNAGNKKDFRDPAFHEYLCELVEDLLEKDVDGISLDFERKAPFFLNESLMEERRQACIEFLRRVRSLSQQPLIVRVCHELSKGELQGQAPAQWLAEGLVDIVVPATHNHEPDALDWFPQAFVDAAGRSPRACMVFPQIWPTSDPWNNGNNRRHKPADVRQRVDNLRTLCADGVYFFNFFPQDMLAAFPPGSSAL